MVTSAEHGAVISAIKKMIDREVERVDDVAASVPGGDPSDFSGWVPYHPDHTEEERAAQIGRPRYGPESWRWFTLVDVAILDGAAVVKFRWDEPGSPQLDHLVFIGLGRYLERGSDVAALVARSHLRVLLSPHDRFRGAPTNTAPGWRNRVIRIWLAKNLVVVAHPEWPDHVTGGELQERLDLFWNTADRQDPDARR